MRTLAAPPASPEAELILRCCAVSGDADRLRQSANSVASDFDWVLFEQLAERSGVMPTVARRLLSIPLPESASATVRRLKIDGHAISMRNQHLAGELIRILDAFSLGGIEALAFKGPVLAQLCYGDLAMRSFADLDLLVHRSDVVRAAQVLVGDGYRLASGDAHPVDPHIFTAFESGFEAKRDDNFVDLHWRIKRRRFHFFPADEGLWSRSIRIDFEGHRVRTFAPADLLIYLCVHAAKHGWLVLHMVLDLAQLLARFPGLNLDQALSDAERLGCRRMLLMGLYLSGTLLDASVPAALLSEAERDRDLVALAADISARMFTHCDDPVEAENYRGIAVKLMDRKLDRARYWFYRSVTPTMGDWEWFPLPRALYPAYFLIRPLRLTFTAAKARRTRIHERKANPI